ncbi:hypothetical protein ILUMI_19415 [Ignelater luminosus]|uniref:Uncharacterized protein n=1 Tax=Ignelater luminosus TaxID=2038154 RepID=A0A8K0CLR8_IGNLU|nr:hypothetical protein ILUMI_19415 [Ignelater luminosus]
MKSFLVWCIFIFTLIINTARSNKQIWGVGEEDCVKELNLNKETIITFDKQKDDSETSEDFNNFLACSWKKKGIEKKDGDINWDKIYEILFDEFQTEFKEQSRITTLLGGELVEDAVRKCHVKFDQKKSSTEKYNTAELRKCVGLKLEETLNDFDSVKLYSHKLFYKIFTY